MNLFKYTGSLEQYRKERPPHAEMAKTRAWFTASLLSAIPERETGLRERVEQVIAYFSEDFVRADTLAKKYQRLYKHASMTIYMLSVLAVIVVAAQYLFHLHHDMIAVEILAMMVIILIITCGEWVGWHRRWIDYRFLAERIRYGLYRGILVTQGKPHVDKSLPSIWSGETWCLRYYNHLYLGRPGLALLARVDEAAVKEFIKQTWLEDQLDYHKVKAHAMYRKHTIISSLSGGLFVATLLVAFLHFLPVIQEKLGMAVSESLVRESASSILTFFAIAFPALATTCTGLRSHFDFNKVADRSKMMEHSLEHLLQKLAKSNDLNEIIEVVIDAESLMIQENSDWYINVGLHRLEPV